MPSKPNGGPAFPIPEDAGNWRVDGMTYRQWLIGMALGAKTEGKLIGYEDHAPEHRAELIRRLSRDCIEIADEIISQLESEEPDAK